MIIDEGEYGNADSEAEGADGSTPQNVSESSTTYIDLSERVSQVHLSMTKSKE